MAMQVKINKTGSRARGPVAERLSRYSAAAAGAATVVGGVTGQVGATVVTSSGSGPVWTGTVTGTAASQSSFVPSSAWGNSILVGKLGAGVALFTGNPASRAGFVQGIGGAGIRRARLTSGAVVGPTGSFVGIGGGPYSTFSSGGAWMNQSTSGSWSLGGTNSVRGYLAFRIPDGSANYYYGYLDLEYSRGGTGATSYLTMTLHGWAFENVAGQSITIGAPSAVPGGAGLAALAFGAVGLRGRRRNRN